MKLQRPTNRTFDKVPSYGNYTFGGIGELLESIRKEIQVVGPTAGTFIYDLNDSQSSRSMEIKIY